MTKEEAIKYLQQLYPNGGHCWLDEQRIEAVGMAVKALQEEPAPKIFEDMLNAKTPAENLGISAEEHDKIIDLCLYGKEPEMVDIDDLPKEEPVVQCVPFEPVGVPVDKVVPANIPDKKEEPVSEDLEKAARSYSNNIDNICGSIGEQTRNAFKAGARWADEHPRKGFVDINSVCGWLITHLNDYIETGFIGEYTTFEEFRIDDLIKDLYKSYDY